MATRKTAEGKAIQLTTSAAVTQGTLDVVGGFFGLILVTADALQTTVVEVGPGVYETTQVAAADSFDVGAKVYWDAVNKVLTTNVGTNQLVGRVVRSKDADGTIEFYMIPS